MAAQARTAKKREEHEIEFSRIVAFSDGVFSIAITLLVLNLGIEAGLEGDRLWDAIWDERENFLAYAISFAVIGRFWVVHHQFFGEVRAFDTRLIALNLLYLGFIVLIPFSSQVLGEYGGEAAAVVVYAVNLAVCTLVSFWMSFDARRAGFTIVDQDTDRARRVSALYIVGIFLATIPLAFVVPDLAPLLWLALFFDPGKVVARRAGRKADART